MTLITVGSVVGSPGATTTALALARAHTTPVVLLETDPDGGRLATWMRCEHRPGLVDLLASAHALGVGDSFDWVQRPDALSSAQIVMAPPSGEVVDRALRAGLHDLIPPLTAAPFDIVCDIGRYRVDSPVESLIASATCRVIVTRGDLADVAVLSHALERLRPWGASVVAVAGRATYGAGEVEDALTVPTVHLPAVGGVLPNKRYLRALADLAALVWSRGAS
jgi:hypothetical protein